MSQVESNQFIEVMLEQDDYDIVHKVGEVFGFETFGGKQKFNPFTMCRKKGQKTQSLTQIENQEPINRQRNFYEKLSLVRCQVNVFAMKKFIRNNIKSMREIYIEDCKFYLSDEDASEDRNRVKNQRMLQEINFVWLIEQYKFQDIITINIKLLKDVFFEPSIQQRKLRNAFQHKTAKVLALNNSPQIIAKRGTVEQIDVIEESLSKEQFIELFKCEENSKFLEYETESKAEFKKQYSKDKLQILAQNLIWGDLQDQEKFIDKLYDNTLSDIQQNLYIYKKYTKYALNGGKLIIIGDVLYNGISQNQLYNLIQLKCKEINGIIFKDNGKIPPKVFSDLMKQIFMIPSLEQIAFLSSVLDESSLYELQYLFQMKKVQFIILFRSYFLRSEIDELLNMEDSAIKLEINHQRFVVIDINQKKEFEFTPYAFNLDEIQKKKKEDLLVAEKLYQQQEYYPLQVYNQIVFFQGRKLSTLNKNGSESILFENWDLLNKSKEQQKEFFQQKQEALIQILEKQFREDDINILNYSLVKTMISLVIENETRNLFQELLNQQKSFKLLKERFSLKVAEKIVFAKQSHLQTAYSYLLGFTTIKEMSVYYYFRNDYLYEDVRDNNKKFLLQLKGKEYGLIIKESFTAQDKTEQAIQAIYKELQIFVNFEKLTELSINESRDPDKNFLFLNSVFKGCKCLRLLELESNMLNNIKLEGVDFSLISGDMEEFSLNHNKNIDDMSFLNGFFKKARKLKKLKLQNMQLTAVKAKTVDFTLVSPTLEDLDLGFNVVTDPQFINDIFAAAPNIKKINFTQQALNTEIVKQIKFAPGLKEININFNANIALAELILHLGQTEGLELEGLEAYVLESASKLNPEYEKYAINGQLKAFSKLKKLHLQRNRFDDPSYTNLILSNVNSGFIDLKITDQKLKSAGFNQLKLDHLYPTLEILDLSYGHEFGDFNFLVTVFEKAVKLKVLKLCFGSIVESRMSQVSMDTISDTLEEFYFNGNVSYSRYENMLNKLFSKCVNLKVLHLEDLQLNDDKLKNVNFNTISTKLEDLNISNNPNIKTYYFLNEIFRRAPNLKKLNLKKNKIGKAVEQINFDLMGKQVEIFRADEDDFYNEEFQDKLINKLERYLNIYTFQQKYSNTDNYKYINNFGVFEKFNLSQIGLSTDQNKDKANAEGSSTGTEEKKQNLDLDNEERKQLQLKEKKEKAQQQEEELKKSRRDKMIKQAKKNNVLLETDFVENSVDVNYIQHTNPMYFYSFFSKLDQLIPERDQEAEISRKSKDLLNTNLLLEKIIEYQNVYMNKDYNLLQFIDAKQIKEVLKSLPEKSNNASLDYDLYFSALKELNLQNQKYPNLDFLTFFFENGQHLTKLNMSNMDLKAEILANVSVRTLNLLVDVDFSKNKCTSTNIFGFIHKILTNAPNLEKLNLSDMDMNGDSVCDFSAVSQTLRELDISNNKKIPTLSVLNELFQRCTQLRKLNISKTGLNNKKLDSTFFSYISTTLEEFDCSDNEKLDVVDFINTVIARCQNLQKLIISNCNIDYQKNNRVQYYELSPTLKHLDISKNSILYFMAFLADIIERCPNLDKLDMSGQVSPNQYDSLFDPFTDNSLRDFDFSGNTIYNQYDFISSMILKSTNFRRLTIQKINLSQKRLEYFKFNEIGKQILELDISDNNNLSDITALNFIKDSPDFSVFIAKKTTLNNALMNQLEIPQLFRNIKRLELSECTSFVNFEFMNTIFESAVKLEYFIISGMQITQAQIEQVNFKLISSNLIEFDFSENKLITDYSFLNDLFSATKNTLTTLNLSNCKLTEEKLQKCDFGLLSKKIETLDISKNDDLISINFIKAIFENSPAVKLKKLKITKSNYEITYVLQQHCKQIEEIECPFQRLDLEFFSQKKFITNINFVRFLQYLISSSDQQSFCRRSDSQTLWEGKDPKGQIFKQFLKNMMEYKSESKPLQTIQHFFFLLLNEERLYSKQYTSDFFIFSPYSLFQQHQDLDCQYDQLAKTNLTIDSYNLAFLDLNILNKQTDYIFGYDKFFFPEFPDFYVQNLQGKGSDLKFIVELKKKMEKYKVSNAFLPIRLNLNPSILQEVGLNEFEVLYLINFIPPAVVNLKGMSIQFVKSWYAINFYAPLSVQTLIDVDYDLIENSSIANFLTLRSYRLYVRNFEGKTFMSKIYQVFGKFSYSFFHILSSQPKQYNFDHTVIHLENKFKQYVVEGKHTILRVLYPIYLIVCIFGVWFFSHYYNVECGGGVSWYSYVTYAVFGIITFFFEAFIFNTCLKYVSHLIPELKPDCRISFPYPYINAIKLLIMDVNWINQWYVNYAIAFILSQLSRFDFFTNIGFLYQTYSCDDMFIFTLAVISLSITTFTGIIFFIMNFMGADTYGRLVTGQIDKLYQICNLLEFQAVADVLDIISPSNSVIIFGKMFNQRIVNNFIRILFQDIPFIIIQALYLIRKGEFHVTMLFSLISSGLMFLVSLNKFLTITPSRLGQEDFNQLNEIKKNRVLPNYLTKLSRYEKEMVKFNQYEQLKCIRSSSYFQKILSNDGNLSVREIKQQLKMAQKLRSFQSNKEFLQDVFGNQEFNDMSINSKDSPIYRLLEEKRRTKIIQQQKENDLALVDSSKHNQKRKSSMFSKKDSIVSLKSSSDANQKLLMNKLNQQAIKENQSIHMSHTSLTNQILIQPHEKKDTNTNIEKSKSIVEMQKLKDDKIEENNHNDNDQKIEKSPVQDTNLLDDAIQEQEIDKLIQSPSTTQKQNTKVELDTNAVASEKSILIQDPKNENVKANQQQSITDQLLKEAIDGDNKEKEKEKEKEKVDENDKESQQSETLNFLQQFANV